MELAEQGLIANLIVKDFSRWAVSYTHLALRHLPVVFDADVGFPHGLIKRAGSKQLRLCAGGFDRCV